MNPNTVDVDTAISVRPIEINLQQRDETSLSSEYFENIGTIKMHLLTSHTNESTDSKFRQRTSKQS